MSRSSNSGYSDISTLVLEDFDILEQLYNGRCTVYSVKCNKGRLKNRQLALKKIPVSRDRSSTSLAVPGEDIHQSLCHPNIVSLYSTFYTPLANYHVFESCPSGSLDGYMRVYGSRAIEEHEIKRLLKGLFDALGYLKNQCIVHRGVDMSSILLTTEHSVKLSNFKNALRLPEFKDVTNSPIQYITEFTAPEIKDSSMHGFPVDMWSAGCVALTCLINHPGMVDRDPHFKYADIKVGISRIASSKLKDLVNCLLRSKPQDRISVTEACNHPLFRAESITSPVEHTDKEDIPLPRTLTGFAFNSLNTVKGIGGADKARPVLKDILSDVRNLQLREPFSRAISDRRIVSDPTKNTFLDKVELLPRRSKSVSSKGRAKFARENDGMEVNGVHRIGSQVSTKQAIPIGTVRPSPFSTFPLHPKTHKAAQGHVTVLPSRSLLVDFREGQRRRGFKGDDVILINPHGTEVKIYKAPHLSAPCCLIEPVRQYTLTDVPSTYWSQYNDAAELVEKVKSKTPKLVQYGTGIKYTLMANTPLGDVEVIFDSFWLGPSSGHNDPSATSKSQPKMRLCLSKRRSSLEIARHITNGDGEEWTKKVITVCQDNEHIISEREFSQLELLEQKAIHELRKFVLVCISVEGPSEGMSAKKEVNESSTTFLSSRATHGTSLSTVVPSDETVELKKGRLFPTKIPETSHIGEVSMIAKQLSYAPSLSSAQSPPQTRFLPSVGWCMRHRASKLSHWERYQIMFLDGATLEVNVDQETVEYSGMEGKVERCRIRECVSKPHIFKRMGNFEDFVALFETDT